MALKKLKFYFAIKIIDCYEKIKDDLTERIYENGSQNIFFKLAVLCDKNSIIQTF